MHEYLFQKSRQEFKQLGQNMPMLTYDTNADITDMWSMPHRDYGTMSRIKESSKALPIINRSTHHKNSPPREHDDANSAVEEEERLAKANLLVCIPKILACKGEVYLPSSQIYQLQSEVSVLREDVEEVRVNSRPWYPACLQEKILNSHISTNASDRQSETFTQLGNSTKMSVRSLDYCTLHFHFAF